MAPSGERAERPHEVAIELRGITFAWPDVGAADGEDSVDGGAVAAGDASEAASAGGAPPLFSDLSLELPVGMTFFVGPNGIGKSTLMVLAGARIAPQRGDVRVFGRDTASWTRVAPTPAAEEERNRLVSFIYQNMELESDAPLGELLAAVGDAAGAPAADVDDVCRVADLNARLDRPLQELSKGEHQRALVAMSILYRSPVLFLDEPLFAAEPRHADSLYELLAARARSAPPGEPLSAIFLSVHDVEVARRWASGVVLFDGDGTITVGEPQELLRRERLERAFAAPWDTLYERQRLFRELLTRHSAS